MEGKICSTTLFRTDTVTTVAFTSQLSGYNVVVAWQECACLYECFALVGAVVTIGAT